MSFVEDLKETTCRKRRRLNHGYKVTELKDECKRTAELGCDAIFIPAIYHQDIVRGLQAQGIDVVDDRNITADQVCKCYCKCAHCSDCPLKSKKRTRDGESIKIHTKLSWQFNKCHCGGCEWDKDYFNKFTDDSSDSDEEKFPTLREGVPLTLQVRLLEMQRKHDKNINDMFEAYHAPPSAHTRSRTRPRPDNLSDDSDE